MAKTRVHELAKEFGVESKFVLEKFKEMGEFVKSASSTVELPAEMRFRKEYGDTLKAAAIEGVRPDADTIASGDYGVARPLFIYIKNAHRGVIPGLDEFVVEYVSDESFGPDGYLSERGLIALSDEEREQIRTAVESGTPMEAVTN